MRVPYNISFDGPSVLPFSVDRGMGKALSYLAESFDLY